MQMQCMVEVVIRSMEQQTRAASRRLEEDEEKARHDSTVFVAAQRVLKTA